MAVGDILNGIFTNVAALNYFQPAAGTETMVLAVSGYSNMWTGLANGVNTAATLFYNASNPNKNSLNIKLGITNTNYLVVFFDTEGGYSGIQIK